MKIQLIRHATLTIHLNNKKILVDPMLSKVETLAPIPDVPNQEFNPLAELPIDIDSIIDCDAILVTHTHRDHFDDAAAELLPKHIPIFCQPEDESKLKSYGFINVCAIENTYIWNSITLSRTAGQHGHDDIAKQMAPVSGFVLSSFQEPSIYISGDTVWCDEVEAAISYHKPKIVICNCGGAQFSHGKPITMTTEDIHTLKNKFPDVTIVAVHMETWNHCRLSRKDLKDYLIKNNIYNSILIPEDGESIWV